MSGEHECQGAHGPRFWRSLEELSETPEARRAAEAEFLPTTLDPADPPPAGLTRRTFMELVGASAALAATACSRKDTGTLVPYTRRPPEVVPGVATWYSSAFQEGTRAYSVLVKTREGRPLHITGNDEHPTQRGRTAPRAIADLLRLYDPDRLRAPRIEGRKASWREAEARLLEALKGAGGPVLLVTGALQSPSRRALLAQLQAVLPSLEHLAWEPVGQGALQAAVTAFGQPLSVHPRLAKARSILSLGANFLNGDDPEALADFAARRTGSMNRLWAFEGTLTLTGAKADHRFPLRPSRLGALALALARDLRDRHGLAIPGGLVPPALDPESCGVSRSAWTALVEDLGRAGPEALVLCGPDMPLEAHHGAHLLNAMLGSRALELWPAESLASSRSLRERLRAGAAAVILWGVNPALAFPEPDLLARIPRRFWIGQSEDETSALCQVLLPEPHWLEAWGDLEARGTLLLQQPTLRPLHDTRQGEDVLLGLARGLGAALPADYHAFLRARWEREVFPKGSPVPFERFFHAALHDGLVPDQGRPLRAPNLRMSALAESLRHATESRPGFELQLSPGLAVHDGRYANNGWLQELPDPVTKVVWGNPLALSVADGRQLGLQDGDLVRLEAGGTALDVPVLLQPGQALGVLSLSLGYGRQRGSVATGVGVNAYVLVDPASPGVHRSISLKPMGTRHPVVRTQGHHRMEGRDLVRGLTVAEAARQTHPSVDPVSLYPEQRFPEHRWGMVIDLSACVGCGGCVLACQSENNIPVVGPAQVAKGREMHWIRLDRYFEGDLDNPRVLQQPMLCQHCDSAPCENVCPVNATNHSPDGLNQMVYNRCVGTRYCANNCPYKVRRFNFLEFTAQKREPESLVHNPEVTVRPRGVMEKCTFCVQRIQDGRMRARSEGRPLRDGDIEPACAAACPAHAITFGDLRDPLSRVSRLAGEGRAYKVLEEVGTRPAITYLADVRNPVAEGGFHG
jgi:MoCo/4Fe-4S cofactor protein with predicted Tat translocation signal